MGLSKLFNSMFPIMAFFVGLGLVSLGVIMFIFGAVEDRFISLWVRRPIGKRDRFFRTRIRFATSPSALVKFTPLLLGLLPAPLILWASSSPQYALTYLLGFLGFSLMAYPLRLAVYLKNFRMKLAHAAVRKLVKVGDNAFTEQLLLSAASSAEPEMRMAAAEGFKRMGTPACNAALDKLCGDRNMKVSLLACQAATDLNRALSGKHVLPLAPMKDYIKVYLAGTQSLRRAGDTDAEIDPRGWRYAVYEMEKIIDSQLLLRRAFPSVYCKNCLCYAELKGLEDWKWVACPRCEDATALEAAPAGVIGQIGVEPPMRIDAGTIYVNLWDLAQKKAMNAEVDHIEVLAGYALDYDWAISAVLEMFSKRSTGKTPKPRLLFLSDPPISINTQHLIRDYQSALLPA